MFPPSVVDHPVFHIACVTRPRGPWTAKPPLFTSLDTYHTHSPGLPLPPQQPPPNYNPAAFPQPPAHRVSALPPPKPERLGALPCGRNSSSCVTTSPQNYYSRPVPYRPQYQTPPPPHHRASLASPQQPQMYPKSNSVQAPSPPRQSRTPSLPLLFQPSSHSRLPCRPCSIPATTLP